MHKKGLIAIALLLTFVVPSKGIAQQKRHKPTAKPKTAKQVNIPPADMIDSAIVKYHLTPLAIMSPIPNPFLPLHSVDGKTMTLHDAQKKNGLLVMFSCNTCPFVHKAEAHTKDMMEYTKQKDIGMVIINSNQVAGTDDETPGRMGEYAHRMQYTVPYLIDPNALVANLFAATHTPEVFLFNGQGNLIYRGAMEDNPADPEQSTHFYIKEAIDSMLANKPYFPPMTKSIGCTIKRPE